MEVDILIEAPEWEALDLEAMIEASVDATLSELGLQSRHYALSVLAADDPQIAELNAEFRGKPTPTNVLSWPAEDRAPDRSRRYANPSPARPKRNARGVG